MKTIKTNKVSFTPGPWHASKDERCIYAKLQTTDGTYVETLIAQCSKITTSATANAALIAAAPEMFEALEKIQATLLEKHKGTENHTYELLLISDIIKKAKGE